MLLPAVHFLQWAPIVAPIRSPRRRPQKKISLAKQRWSFSGGVLPKPTRERSRSTCSAPSLMTASSSDKRSDGSVEDIEICSHSDRDSEAVVEIETEIDRHSEDSIQSEIETEGIHEVEIEYENTSVDEAPDWKVADFLSWLDSHEVSVTPASHFPEESLDQIPEVDDIPDEMKACSDSQETANFPDAANNVPITSERDSELTDRSLSDIQLDVRWVMSSRESLLEKESASLTGLEIETQANVRISKWDALISIEKPERLSAVSQPPSLMSDLPVPENKQEQDEIRASPNPEFNFVEVLEKSQAAINNLRDCLKADRRESDVLKEFIGTETEAMADPTNDVHSESSSSDLIQIFSPAFSFQNEPELRSQSPLALQALSSQTFEWTERESVKISLIPKTEVRNSEIEQVAENLSKNELKISATDFNPTKEKVSNALRAAVKSQSKAPPSDVFYCDPRDASPAVQNSHGYPTIHDLPQLAGEAWLANPKSGAQGNFFQDKGGIWWMTFETSNGPKKVQLKFRNDLRIQFGRDEISSINFAKGGSEMVINWNGNNGRYCFRWRRAAGSNPKMQSQQPVYEASVSRPQSISPYQSIPGRPFIPQGSYGNIGVPPQESYGNIGVPQSYDFVDRPMPANDRPPKMTYFEQSPSYSQYSKNDGYAYEQVRAQNEHFEQSRRNANPKRQQSRRGRNSNRKPRRLADMSRADLYGMSG